MFSTDTDSITTAQNVCPAPSHAVTIPVVAARVCLPLDPALFRISVWFHSALSFSLLLTVPSHLPLTVLACVSLCCLSLSLPPCFPTALGTRIDRRDVMATQATNATNKREGLLTDWPQERGVCLCVHVLINFL